MRDFDWAQPLHTMRTNKWVLGLVTALSVSLSNPAAARDERYQFDIGSTSLSLAIIEVGRQSNTPVATLIADLPLIRTPAVRGTMNVDQALKQLLAGTGFRHRKARNGTYMIERAKTARAPKAPSAPKAVRRAASMAQEGDDEPDFIDPNMIIVTASKNDTPLRDYAGGAYVTALNDNQIRAGQGRGSDAMVELLPMLASSSMGSGRNKIYGRAISDGSFNGFMQSNLGVYLGEQRLGYSAPDPNLQLFDVDHVEVLLGPHGTLYGSGTLGGVLRIQPTAPNLSRREGMILGEVAKVEQGGHGGTISATINQPLVTDRLALRAVAYQLFEPGYLDHIAGNPYDPPLTAKNSNSVTIRGGRAALRWEWDDSNRLDLNLVYQRIKGRDIAHTAIAPPRLESDTPILQPFGNEYFLRSLAYEKQWDEWKLTSVSGWINQEIEEIYHQLTFSGMTGYLATDRDIMVLTHETRVTADLGAWNLIMGVSALKNRSTSYDRNMGLHLGFDVYDRASRISTLENAVFGEIRRDIGSNITVMMGARLAHVNEKIVVTSLQTGQRSDQSLQKRWNFLPSTSVAWKGPGGHLLFITYREGFRSSGMFPPAFMGLSGGAELPPRPDKIKMVEAGYRFSGSSKLSLSISGYYTRWSDRNVDGIIFLIGGYAPANMGDVTIWGGDAVADWKVSSRFQINAGVAVNNLPHYVQAKPASFPDDYIMPKEYLPNIAQITARMGAQYAIPLDQHWDLNLSGAIRYRGKSYGEFNIPIKPAEEIGTEARISNGQYAFWFKVSNLLNNKNNIFSGGNPFYSAVQSRTIYTPMRPRNFALGASAKF